jgi:hypothetical protein
MCVGGSIFQEMNEQNCTTNCTAFANVHIDCSFDPGTPDCAAGGFADVVRGDQRGDGNEVRSALQSLNKLSARSVPELIGRGIELFTGFFGSIALLMVIYGGVQIMIAGGQGEKIKEGTKIIVWASIGLITMMLSYVLVSFVFGAIL